jgi:hypothetical protein
MIKKIIYCCDFCKKEVTEENKNEFKINKWWYACDEETHFACCSDCYEKEFLDYEMFVYVDEDDEKQYLLTHRQYENEGYYKKGYFIFRDVVDILELEFVMDLYFLFDINVDDEEVIETLDKVLRN